MKLNLDIIHDYLPESYGARRFGPENRQLSFGRPLLFGGNMVMRKGCLYVAQTENLPKNLREDVGVICFGGRIPSQWMDSGVQILYVENAEDVYLLLADIHAVYDKFEQWDGSLRDELENDVDFSIMRMLQTGIQVLENPIGISDHSLQVLFYCELVTGKDGNVHPVVTNSPVPITLEYMQYIDSIKDVCQVERMITVPYMSTIPNLDHYAYCNNLYPMGYFMGCAHICSLHRPFRESDFPLADYFFFYLQKGFLKYLLNFNQTEALGTKAVQNLLNHHPLNAQERDLLSLKEEEYWLCFKLKENRKERYLPKDYMYAIINGLIPWAAYAVMHHGQIVGLLKFMPNTTNAPGDSLELFQNVLQRMGYVAGISNKFTDLQKISSYLLQAGYAVEKYSFTEETMPFCFFQDYALQYMLDECCEKLSPEALYSDGLRALVKHDKEKGTEFVQTLNLYLQCETNASQAAELLYIHRSSIIKRLAKIRELLDADLQDPEVRLYLRICLKLMENEP